jgi:acyl-coenzyme A thioesterase PaaI-like protein
MNAPDPNFASRIRESFGRQKAMALIGASLAKVQTGEVDVALPYREDLTVEYKMNILRPGRGSLVAQGSVIRAGRTLTVARAEVYADDGSHVATMLQTLMALPHTPDTAE